MTFNSNGGVIGVTVTTTASANNFGGNLSAADLKALFEAAVASGSAKGVWNLKTVFQKVKSSEWPGFGAIANAIAQAGGTETVNSVALGSYDYTFYSSSQTVSSFTNSDWFTTTADSRSALIYINGNLTINSGVTFIPSNRKLFTAIYVTGDLIVNGTLSMTGRGSNHGSVPVSSGNIKLIAPGTYSAVPDPQIPSSGGAGGPPSGQANPIKPREGFPGSAGTAGGTGGGGGGGAEVGGAPGVYPGRATGGAGSAGTSFTGGSGGGGIMNLSGIVTAGSATANGGAGGAGAINLNNSLYAGQGGGGNPGGAGKAPSPAAPAPAPAPANAVMAGNSGTGGVLIIYVAGSISGTGVVEAKGTNQDYNFPQFGPVANVSNCGGGGATGGGSITIFRGGSDGFTPGGTLSAAGGAGLTGPQAAGATGGNGGVGTARVLSTS
jgi:hypothetical protein